MPRAIACVSAADATVRATPEWLSHIARDVSRGLSRRLARQVAIELTAHDALAAHAEAEHGITPASLASPLRDALAVGAAFVAGAVLPWLAIILIPGPPRAAVTFVIVLLALALTGWISAQISDVHPVRPIVRTAAFAVVGQDAKIGLQAAFVHLLYDVFAIIVIYVIPVLRPVPLFCAETLAPIAAERKWVVALYLITVFIVLPALVIILVGVL
jgi:hypothetical protein